MTKGMIRNAGGKPRAPLADNAVKTKIPRKPNHTTGNTRFE
jgi:hypothetical protein